MEQMIINKKEYWTNKIIKKYIESSVKDLQTVRFPILKSLNNPKKIIHQIFILLQQMMKKSKKHNMKEYLVQTNCLINLEGNFLNYLC